MVYRIGLTLTVLACMTVMLSADEWKSGIDWPRPEVVEGTEPTTTPPPEGAVVLLDGKDMSAWNGGDNWILKDGYAEVKGGSVTSKQEFGSCKLHLEWASPEVVRGEGQGRGNSGLFFFDKYELQILDSYENETYYDGQCGSIYKQRPPLKNVCRKPGEWNSYDVDFTAPVFEDGKLVKPGYITVYQNGVLIQDNYELQGSTFWHQAPVYEPHGPKGRLQLQDHGNPIRFRNMWVLEK